MTSRVSLYQSRVRRRGTFVKLYIHSPYSKFSIYLSIYLSIYALQSVLLHCMCVETLRVGDTMFMNELAGVRMSIWVEM